MNVTPEFFKEAHHQMGIFYPKHYLVLAYDGEETARAAEHALRNSGVPEDSVATAGPAEYFLLEGKDTTGGVLDTIVKSLSRGIATEQITADHNRHFAKDGANFVFVYCPTDTEKDKVWKNAPKEGLLGAHHYGRFSVEHVACHFSTT